MDQRRFSAGAYVVMLFLLTPCLLSCTASESSDVGEKTDPRDHQQGPESPRDREADQSGSSATDAVSGDRPRTPRGSDSPGDQSQSGSVGSRADSGSVDRTEPGTVTPHSGAAPAPPRNGSGSRTSAAGALPARPGGEADLVSPGAPAARPNQSDIAAAIKAARRYSQQAAAAARDGRFGEAYALAAEGWSTIAPHANATSDARELCASLGVQMKDYGERAEAGWGTAGGERKRIQIK